MSADKMPRVLLVAACLVLVACDEPEITKAKGEARAAMFRDCMELAAKMPRQADDDVSDIVSACSTQSYYLTNYIK